LVINDQHGGALETQTLSIFDRGFIDGSIEGDGVAAHELAHQWFGDSVTPASWKDVWLNEGFATYAEWMWHEHVDGTSVADTAKAIHTDLVTSVLTGDPGIDHLFDVGAVYQRGALTLQALRLTIGDEAFFTTLRTYASRFAGKSVTTGDFISVAEEVSHRDLSDLFEAWLYRAELPALPS
jgi:aminopeptidase N